MDQIFRYLVVGGLVTAIDIVIYQMLTGRARLARIPANTVSTTCGMLLGFSFHFLIVFHPPDPMVAVRACRYIATVAFSVYGVQNLVIYALGTLWRAPARLVQQTARNSAIAARFSGDFIDRMTGKVAAVIAGLAWNFVWFKYFVYA